MASMEPRPHERGKNITKWKTKAIIDCFNGATSSRTWKGLIVWPRSFTVLVLQWSHVLTNVESIFGSSTRWPTE